MKTKRRTNPVRTNYLVDLSIFTAFLVTRNPGLTGLAVHEWLGLAFGAGAVTHLVLHWQWIAATTRRFLGRVPLQSRINYILNTALFIVMTALIFSGVMISKTALPALGIRTQESFGWRELHFLASDAALIVLGLHVALHWKWIVSVTKRTILAPLRRPETAKRPEKAAEGLPRVAVIAAAQPEEAKA